MAPFTKAEVVWFNGKLVPWSQANVHVSAHALSYGTGVFEGVRSYKTDAGASLFQLAPHMRRLAASARFYELDLGYSTEELCAAAVSVVRENKFTDAYLRPLAFFDSHSFAVWPKGCPVSVAIIAVPGKPYIDGGPDFGARVTISTVRRIDSSTLPPFVKCSGHYTNSVRAVQEAIRRGYDDAIMMNVDGDVAEGSGANLFVVRDGTLITNDLNASIVSGITRGCVLELARDLQIPVVIRNLSLMDIELADELFFSGTAVEITPINEVDGRVVGPGKPGPITRRLQSTFYEAARGKLSQYARWLTRVIPSEVEESAPRATTE